MDDLTDSEIEGVWVRIKHYIDTSDVKSVIAHGQQQDLKRAMKKTVTTNDAQTSNMDFLIDHNFHKRAIESQKIRSELIGQHISEVKIKGKSRYTISKGTPSFVTTSGKLVRAGQFLSGKTRAEASQNLSNKSS